MTFLTIFLAILVIALIWFICWFMSIKINGQCPICALKQILIPSKITIDTEKDEKYDNNAALTPPMGWSSWNTFRQTIDEKLIYETAKAMKDSGLADCGYKYINLDDCWQSSLRDENGLLQNDLTTFPHGIAHLVKKINALGLKVGIYSSNGTYTCEDLPASLGTELIDAKTFVSWGCELLKYDFCHNVRLSSNAPLVTSIAFARKGEADFLKLTADDAELNGMAKKVKFDKVPEGSYISNLNHAAGKASFDFTLTEGGKYVLTINYHKTLKGQTCYLQADINGKITEIEFPKNANAFSATSRLQLIVDLKQGQNKITLFNPVATNADSSYIQYRRMGNALKQASKEWAEFSKQPEKPVVFSICEWGAASPYMWGAKAGNLWRTTQDILPNWFSILYIYNKTVKLYKYASPGAWNDPDMLEVGNGKLTFEENKSHFSLWCMMAAPLILGNDIRKFVENGKPVESEILDIVKNKELIEIDQDALGKQAKRIKHSLFSDVLAKPLANGDIALCFFNKKVRDAKFTFEIDSLANDEYLNFSKSDGNYTIKDLWNGEVQTGKTIDCVAKKHGVCVFRISPNAELKETDDAKIENEIEKEIEKDELIENSSPAAETLISEIKSENDIANVVTEEKTTESEVIVEENSETNEENSDSEENEDKKSIIEPAKESE